VLDILVINQGFKMTNGNRLAESGQAESGVLDFTYVSGKRLE
jgi:hypothetical protein